MNKRPTTHISWLGPIVVAVLFIAVVLAFLIGVGNWGVNSDLFLGLASGKSTLQGHLAETDQWSFTARDRAWIDQSWLSNIFYYLSYRLLGPAGPVLIKLLLLAGCVAILFYRCRRFGVSSQTTLFCLWLGLMASAPFIRIRGENFGVFYFIAFTALLAHADVSRLARRFGLPLLLLVWSFSHGSFMLGIGLLGIKVGLVFLRRFLGVAEPWSDEVSWWKCFEWLAVLAITIILAAIANPYGIENILVSFKQVGASYVTSYSADWLPIFSRGNMDWLVGPGSVHIYVGLVIVVLVSAVVLLFSAEIVIRKSAPPMTGPFYTTPSTDNKPLKDEGAIRQTGLGQLQTWLVSIKVDWMMELTTVLIVAAVAFKFRRLIFFSGLSLIPIAAVLISGLEARSRQFQASSASWRIWSNRLHFMPLITGLCVVMATGWLCYRLAILPYIPDNPIMPKRSIARKLMSYDQFSPGLIKFLHQNRLQERIFSGWQISSYLLQQLPDVTLFMDTRDQSLYPAKIINDFFSIMGLHDSANVKRQGLLDAYRVSTIVMTTEPYDFRLALWLLKSRQWGCIYKDDSSVVMARRTSPRFKDLFVEPDFDTLWYPDETSKTRSEAFHARFYFSAMPQKLTSQLEKLVLENPRPNLYKLLSWGQYDKRGCLNNHTRGFLTSEAKRLSRINPLYAHGAEEVTLSLAAIGEILAGEEKNCTSNKDRFRYEILKQYSEKKYDKIHRLYVGPPF